jgi:hypothetical protein
MLPDGPPRIGRGVVEPNLGVPSLSDKSAARQHVDKRGQFQRTAMA